jgi:bisphosphoglycerate-dependent phosphoglycerate mutase
LKEGLKGLDMFNSEAQHASFPDYSQWEGEGRDMYRKKEGRDKIKIAKNKYKTARPNKGKTTKQFVINNLFVVHLFIMSWKSSQPIS